jgi:hypothetical protein
MLLAVLAAPAAAPAAASDPADVADEWRDLHGRCVDAVATAARLDTAGLVSRMPDLEIAYVEDGPERLRVLPAPRPPLQVVPEIGGERLEDDAIDRTRQRVEAYRGGVRELPADAARRQAEALPERTPRPVVVPLRGPGRHAPTGIWQAPGGRFELRMQEYPTAAGFRSVCEVSVARGARPLAPAEAEAVVAAWRGLSEEMPGLGPTEPKALRQREGAVRLAVDAVRPNPRGCAVVASLTREGGRLRSSVGETVAEPGCGGASLAGDAITPHGVLPAGAEPGTEVTQ